VSHVFTVIILVAILIPLTAFFIAQLWAHYTGSSGSGSGLAGPIALATLPLVVLVVILLIFSRTTPVQVTAYAAVLAAAAGALAWGVRSTKESLQNRAELLISEAVSRRPMDRDEIRAMIYANHVMFRVNKSTYVDALNNLLATQRVVLVGGRYTAPGDTAKDAAAGNRRRVGGQWN
jgi:hypothetical protein